MKRNGFFVDGKPFFSVGGQARNSACYQECDRAVVYRAVRAMGGNTVAMVMPWDAFEREEGVFDREFVKTVIREARREGLHLIFLWFASWKNGTMEYAPAFVKRDSARFPRAYLKDGTPLHQLRATSAANREADARAFRELVRTIRDFDRETGTVIAVQVENEAGILGGTARDFSPEGEEAFAARVPEEVFSYIEDNPASLLSRRWRAAGGKKGGWRSAFGRYGAELCTAYHIARYIDFVAAAGKEEYPELFLYVNCWLAGGEKGTGQNLPGLDWPAGCCNLENADLYFLLATHLDAVCPDIYLSDRSRYREVADFYAREGNPLYVPESGLGQLNAGEMLRGAVELGAIGYHVFGVEGVLDPEGNRSPASEDVYRAFAVLNETAASLGRFRGEGNLRLALRESPGDPGRVFEDMGKWRVAVTFGRFRGCDRDGRDARHRRQDESENRFAIIMRESDQVFYAVGDGTRMRFLLPPEDGSIPATTMDGELAGGNAGFVRVTEGHWDADGAFVPVRVRSGDEVRHDVWLSWDCGCVRIELE